MRIDQSFFHSKDRQVDFLGSRWNFWTSHGRMMSQVGSGALTGDVGETLLKWTKESKEINPGFPDLISLFFSSFILQNFQRS